MNIGIVGIGCMGSSLARDFIAAGFTRPHICDTNSVFLKDAEALGLGQSYTADLTVLAAKSDIVFICAPVMAIPAIIRTLAPAMKAGGIITDVGSVKTFILDVVEGDLPENIHYIPAHPVTFGTIGTGPQSGREGVFKGRKFIITPRETTNRTAVETVAHLACTIGANVVEMPPEQHDRILGFTSHLSHVIAFSAMRAADNLSNALGENVVDYAGGSFKDMTRVAASDARMWRDIFLCNRAQIKDGFDVMLTEMQALNTLMQNGDEKELEDFITEASNRRKTCFERE